jgi:Cd2+/Zn2+-exporting ATPase
MNKIKIELRQLLPSVPDVDDACIQRLYALLESKAGVNSAHVAVSEDGKNNAICIHFDPGIVFGFLHWFQNTAFVDLVQ